MEGVKNYKSIKVGH